MQDGIGRGGYRILALVFLGLGALGLAAAALALDPTGFFDWLGLGLAALALVALTVLALASLSGAPRRAAMAPVPQPEPIDLEAMEDLPEGDPTADLGIEYDAPEPAPGPARVQPPPVPIVQPRRIPKDTKGWPAPPAPSGRTRREVTEGGLPRDPGPDIEIEGPAAPRRDPPVLMARTVASAEATGIPDGTGVGKCGNCGVLLLAPKKRPLRLQCPRCERIHTLA